VNVFLSHVRMICYADCDTGTTIPSIRLSVTLRYCVTTAKHIAGQLHHKSLPN